MPQLPNSDISRGSGYDLQKGTLANSSSYAPQMIAVLAEMNTANQSTATTPTLITSRAQAANLYGWGSPMDIKMRILFGNKGTGGVPVYAFPVVAAGSSVAQVQTITVTGTSTAAVTHTVLIGGRSGLESGNYFVNIISGSTPTQTATAIKNAINAVLGCPYIATSSAGVVTLTAAWTGVTSQDLTANMLTYVAGSPATSNPAGISYAITIATPGTGTPALASTLAQFNNQWFTIVDSAWGILDATTNAAYVAFNGNANTQTGQYAPLLFKPGIYFVGDVTDSTSSSADTVITAALLNEMTIAACSAPLSLGLPMEAASNYVVNFANIANNTPNIDIQAIPLPDMPGILPGSTPPTQNSNYTLRNALVGLGMSTVIYDVATNIYYPQDFITTYAPSGEYPPAFRYVCNINKDFNVFFGYDYIRKNVIANKQIANDGDVVNVPNVVKPKDIVGLLTALAYTLVTEGICTNAKFMINSITVVINASNPDRFDITFSYQRSGVTRVISNVATAYGG